MPSPQGFGFKSMLMLFPLSQKMFLQESLSPSFDLLRSELVLPTSWQDQNNNSKKDKDPTDLNLPNITTTWQLWQSWNGKLANASVFGRRKPAAIEEIVKPWNSEVPFLAQKWNLAPRVSGVLRAGPNLHKCWAWKTDVSQKQIHAVNRNNGRGVLIASLKHHFPSAIILTSCTKLWQHKYISKYRFNNF